MRVKDAVGRYGEDAAARHLEQAGMVIVERNWRCATGELDIVARENDTLVFCEVKTRSTVDFGTPAEAVSPLKARRVRRLGMLWLNSHPQARGPELRFDVVSVLRRRGDAALVEHLRGAF